MSDNLIFSYTKRDYEASRKEGLSKIPILSRGQWSDLNSTDPGIIILDYVHALVDMINYYQDHQALEVFMPTAKERANIFRLAKQLSYQIRSAKGATCEVKFTSSLLYDHIIKIPKYSVLKTESGISFLTSDDAYLPAEQGSISVKCIQGEYYEQKYTGTGISQYSSVSDARNQEVLLTPQTIDTDSITITDNVGVTWTAVDHIVFTEANEKAYQVELNPNNSVTIKFGDGERGYVPTESDELTIGYVVNKAEEGRVAANSIIELESTILDGGKVVDFNVTNEKASIGGYSAQSSVDIRERAPGVIKSQYRAVTIADFENLAMNIQGVVSAKAYDKNTNPDLQYHEVKVLITPDISSPEETVSTLVSEVYDYLYQRMIPPTNLQVVTPSNVYIDIDVVVKKIGDISDDNLKYIVQSAVQAYFSELYHNIGEDFYPADLSAVLSRIDNVKYVVSITPNTVVEIADMSVARLGDLTVSIQ